MSEGNNNFRKPLPKTALNEFKLRLSAAPVGGSSKRASLAFGLAKNQPRLTVFTNVETDKNRGMLHAAMDSPTFFAFLQLLEEAISGDSDTKFSIENRNHVFFNGERSKEPKLVSTTLVGKDNEGRVFLGVIGKGITPVKFIFGPSDYHSLLHKDGTPFTESELSVRYARGYLKLLYGLLPSVLDTHFHEEEPRQNNNGGGGGNYQRGGGNNNYQKKQQSRGGGGNDSWGGDSGTSDDFPM